MNFYKTSDKMISKDCGILENHIILHVFSLSMSFSMSIGRG